MLLNLMPSPLMRVFHCRGTTVDCGEDPDLEAVACNAYLLWQANYPDHTASLHIPGNLLAQHALNAALFEAPTTGEG